MSHDKLVRMANQIAIFMETKPHAEGVAGVADHINDFWEPRMRTQLFQIAASPENGLHALVQEAMAQIRRPEGVAG
ncbi:MAG: formate dehydrogenase subunit delta [Paracoccaceae bacterium]|jgi:formate dehydrogenase subunit delta